MIEDVKIVIVLMGVALVSAFVRFKTLIQAITDTALSFTTGYVTFLALSYFDLAGETKSGIAGIVTMYARPLYEFINTMISTKLAEWIDHKVRKNDR